LYIGASNDATELPDPPATEVVNAALKLFAICLPLQTPKIQESILEQMTSFLSANSLQRDVNRKTAMMVNMACALLLALKVAVKETRSPPGSLKGTAVEKVMQDLLHVSASKIHHHSVLSITDICHPPRPILAQHCGRSSWAPLQQLWPLTHHERGQLSCGPDRCKS
jgi:hypothetical protein